VDNCNGNIIKIQLDITIEFDLSNTHLKLFKDVFTSKTFTNTSAPSSEIELSQILRMIENKGLVTETIILLILQDTVQ